MAFSSIGLFIDSRPRLQGQGSVFIFDGLISEDHRREWTWTSEPVEDGTTVSDNRWRKPVPLTIVAIVSSSEALAIDRSRHVKAWQRLIALADSEPAQLFTVTTTLGDYRNMGIQSVSVPVTAATGNSMQSTIVLKPIFVQFTAVAANLADAAQDSGQAEVDLGNQGFAAPA
jgi:hypothetical protein